MFNTICQIAIEKNTLMINYEDAIYYSKKLGLSNSEISKSIDILEERIYLTSVTKNILGDIFHFYLNPYALDNYARLHIKNYDKMKKDVVYYIVDNYEDKAKLNNDDIANKLSTQRVILNLILDKLEDKNLIKMHTSILNGYTSIYYVSDDIKKLKH